jgi:XTP/dITP diphosphohydrolase
MTDICFATNNKNKVEEVWQMIRPDFRILTLDDIQCFEELPETADTLEGNSYQKAEYVYNHYKIPCFADDTGLEVEALHGKPGVYSARYAGEHKNSDDNISLLLKNLAIHNDRTARFRTVVTVIGLQEKPAVFKGVIHGKIAEKNRGTSGFGYDPVFVPEGYSKTFAEMTMAEKNKLSHRGKAIKMLVDYLKNL